MKHWHETAEIMGRVTALAAAGRAAAIATVVAIRGSAYRRPGAKLLVEDDGATMGGVSGGCLEADVREVARRVLATGIPRLLHYDTGSDGDRIWGLGLGCNGSVDLLVQPATAGAALEVARHVGELLRGDRPFAVATAIEGPRAGAAAVVTRGGPPFCPAGPDAELMRACEESLRRGATGIVPGTAAPVFADVLRPPPRLAIFGAGDDAVPLARCALDAGFRVEVVDHRPAALAPGRFPASAALRQARPERGVAEPGTAPGPDGFAVVMTHALEHDREWARALLATDVGYLGMLGPAARTGEILRQLGVEDDRVFGPVGLDVGADGPEQVALAIVAELLAVRARRRPAHLRDRRGGIHDVE